MDDERLVKYVSMRCAKANSELTKQLWSAPGFDGMLSVPIEDHQLFMTFRAMNELLVFNDIVTRIRRRQG